MFFENNVVKHLYFFFIFLFFLVENELNTITLFSSKHCYSTVLIKIVIIFGNYFSISELCVKYSDRNDKSKYFELICLENNGLIR